MTITNCYCQASSSELDPLLPARAKIVAKRHGSVHHSYLGVKPIDQSREPHDAAPRITPLRAKDHNHFRRPATRIERTHVTLKARWLTLVPVHVISRKFGRCDQDLKRILETYLGNVGIVQTHPLTGPALPWPRPCALHSNHPSRWVSYDQGYPWCHHLQPGVIVCCGVTVVWGTIPATIDNDRDTDAHIRNDYTSFT